MICPKCGNTLKSLGYCSYDYYTKRYRVCPECKERFTTEEWIVVSDKPKKLHKRKSKDEYMDL